MHPDLNKEDPQANEKFAKINNGNYSLIISTTILIIKISL